ncbi:MAG: peptidoglycan DD-metalloendopeptidase family protein, partial [Ruminococcus sp.]|nr:peptidoglycan DD-metalloendopeptidase family protein [Ruminococcus sp.]
LEDASPDAERHYASRELERIEEASREAERQEASRELERIEEASREAERQEASRQAEILAQQTTTTTTTTTMPIYTTTTTTTTTYAPEEIYKETTTTSAVTTVTTTQTTTTPVVTTTTTTTTIPAPSSSGFIWPTPGQSYISSPFAQRWGTQHKGIDISGVGIMGANIVASKPGKVTYVSNSCTHNYAKTSSCGCGGGYGNYVIIQHDGTYSTLYGHMTSANVSVGDYVQQNDVIGTVGSTGWSTGAHLHFEVRVNGVQQDPLGFVNP